MMLCEVISFVGAAGLPINFELFLCDAVLDPIKSHVHGFGSFLLQFHVGEADSSCVIDFNRRGRLWMAHFFKGVAKGDGGFGVVKEGTAFCFSS